MNKMIVFMKRKAGISVEAFIEHYENVHIPLNEKWIGRFMSDFIRVYPGELQNFLRGAERDVPREPAGCDYDAISIYTIRDEQALNELFQVAQDPEYQRLLSEDEEKFADRTAGRYGLGKFFSGPGLNGTRPNGNRPR